jgi:hypothetical protein
MKRPEAITAKQSQAIELVVREGLTWPNVGLRLAINGRQLQEWRKGPLFSAALDVARAEYEAEVWTRLRSAAGAAADTLIYVTTDPDEKGAVRVQAANSVLDRSGFRAEDRADPTKVVVPYATREELIEALSAIPADVLAEVLARVTAR